jgi:hypothetical protein
MSTARKRAPTPGPAPRPPTREAVPPLPREIEQLLFGSPAPFGLKMGSKFTERCESTLAISSAVAPFPTSVTQMISTSRGKIYGAELRLPSFQSEAEQVHCFELLAAGFGDRLGQPKVSRKSNKRETSAAYEWAFAGGSLTLHLFEYLDDSMNSPERQVNIEFRKP